MTFCTFSNAPTHAQQPVHVCGRGAASIYIVQVALNFFAAPPRPPRPRCAWTPPCRAPCGAPATTTLSNCAARERSRRSWRAPSAARPRMRLRRRPMCARSSGWPWPPHTRRWTLTRCAPAPPLALRQVGNVAGVTRTKEPGATAFFCALTQWQTSPVLCQTACACSVPADQPEQNPRRVRRHLPEAAHHIAGDPPPASPLRQTMRAGPPWAWFRACTCAAREGRGIRVAGPGGGQAGGF